MTVASLNLKRLCLSLTSIPSSFSQSFSHSQNYSTKEKKMLIIKTPTIYTNINTINFLIFLSLIFASSSSTHLPSDAQALLNFAQKADLHNSLYPFNIKNSHCKWQGVQCLSPKHQRVTRLIIEGQKLGGIFAPNSLTRLDQLRVLSLRNNSLVGPIPDLSGLVNLKALFLHHNNFSGHFPPSIAFLHRIRTVDLSYNKLSGEFPSWLTQLDRLYYLRVEFNLLSGKIPPFNQSTLLIFNVSSNNLSGMIPVTFVLSKFSSSCFGRNKGLCGEIMHRQCEPGAESPFFHPVNSAAAPKQPLLSDDNSQLRGGAELTGESRGKWQGRKVSVIVLWGFCMGVIVLIVSALCFGLALRKQRRRRKGTTTTTMADMSATEDVAAVMRTEDEIEEKVKSAQLEQQQQGGLKKAAAKSGSLVFCAGETHVYTLEQLMRASAELLGRGTIGTTYKAVLDNRLIVCVKRIDSSKIGDEGKEVFEQHMESVGALRHPNLVPLRAYFQAKDERLLVYDYQPNGSLLSLIHGSKSTRAKPLHWTSCLKIAEDVAQGLSYIHQAWRLVHGNLKSSNVLLGSDFEACVTDYCLNSLTDSSMLVANDPDSLGYKAPETRKSDSQATPKSDVYAFGVLLLELLTGKPPSQHPYLTPNDIVQWVRLARDVDEGGRDENRLSMLLEVAIACSVASPEQRPNMWQVLKMLQEIQEVVLMEDNELDPREGMA